MWRDPEPQKFKNQGTREKLLSMRGWDSECLREEEGVVFREAEKICEALKYKDYYDGKWKVIWAGDGLSCLFLFYLWYLARSLFASSVTNPDDCPAFMW